MTPFTGQLAAVGYTQDFFYFVFQNKQNNVLVSLLPIYKAPSEDYLNAYALSYKNYFLGGKWKLKTKKLTGYKRTILATDCKLVGFSSFSLHNATIIKKQPLEPLLKLLATHFNVVFV